MAYSELNLNPSVIDLYRAVSIEELKDIKTCGQFRPHPDGRSMEAKWFLQSFEDAKKWGKVWYFGTENMDAFYIVKASIPSNVAKTMFHAKNIDYIGDGVSIYEEFLDQLKPLNSWKIERQKK
jgi:hypothetical protein